MASSRLECDNFYQISDDDIDCNDNLPDDSPLDTIDGGHSTSAGIISNSSGQPRGTYERAWTTEATRALIHIRGPMEDRFSEGRQKRTALWLSCTRQMQKMGFRYSAAKVQKKWHNILITYNKNLCKKYTSGYVHWEFFEEMFKYLQGKRANFEITAAKQQQDHQTDNFNKLYVNDSKQKNLSHHVELDSKSNDDYDEEDSTVSDIKKPKIELNDNNYEYPLEIVGSSNYDQLKPEVEEIENDLPKHLGEDANSSIVWWQDYFERKLQVERDKIYLQKEMHQELMQFNKMSLLQQEKIERVKIDAINSLTNTLQKLVVKYKKD